MMRQRVSSIARLRRFIFSAVAVLLCGAYSLYGAYSSPRAGMRSGSVALFGASLAFGDLDLTIGASKMSEPQPMQLTVQLSRHERWTDRDPDCFVAPDDMHVTVDGQVLELSDKGGKARPMMISGVEMQLINCAPAIFRSRMNSIFEDRVESTVVVEGSGRRADARIRHLLARRQVQIEPSNQLRPGDRVTLVWTPAEDEWSGSTESTDVHIYYPNDFSVVVKPDVAPPRFIFVVPSVRPGPAKMGLNTIYLQAHPNVLACTGLNSCYAVADSPAEVEVTVAPR
ncbi:hypothetical protein [Pendulispora albinea]|uniref:Uncharacterized protein n=1 Tax=Pendulispora albinea TaxID=2741071 RepID=A0ABZ2M753_9BACT